MEIDSNTPRVHLRYRVFKSTGHSGKYVPENILIDNPLDQSSRWSGASQPQGFKQWIILELEESAIVRSITFGKFHKSHPCNMKEFSVSIGRTMDSLTTVLNGCLVNSPVPEAFDIPSPSKSRFDVPIRYIKITPASASSPSFNTSIWHVGLSGISDPSIVNAAKEAYDNYRESTALRYVLKYLRRRRHLTSFNSLMSRTAIPFENQTVSKLYDRLMAGEWAEVESLVEAAANDDLFEGFINSYPPRAIWRRLDGANVDGDIPSARGGHQMCIDPESRTIYLFGGWDGKQNLDDLWAYSIIEERWRLISSSTRAEGGPGPRSCHQMVLDSRTGYIYVLGCLPEAPEIGPPLASRSPEAHGGDSFSETPGAWYKPDFYRYATRGVKAGTWKLLSSNTVDQMGPRLLHDHQMVIDSQSQMLYIFGGRIVDRNPEMDVMRFSGFFEYDITANRWTEHLLPDIRAEGGTIPSRFGHSMLFIPKKRQLLIMAGKEHDTFVPDMHTYQPGTQTVKEITKDFTLMGGPEPCFSQRAVVEPDTGHIIVLPGLLKAKSERAGLIDGTLRTSVWIFKPESNEWVEALPAQPPSDMDIDKAEDNVEIPPPRYAHQMVYDSTSKRLFVHGGNAGKDSDKRLDDFWSITLEHPSPLEVIRRAKFIVRRQQFKELCESVTPVEALTFLQRNVHAVVDHSSDEEAATFRSLHSHLFTGSISSKKAEGAEDISMTAPNPSASSNQTVSTLQKDEAEKEDHVNLTPERFRERTQMFESLMEFINTGEKEPDKDLVDILAGSDFGEPMLL